MNKERLEHLCEVLVNVPPEKFDLKAWKCDTAACAIGWACIDKQFNKQGFRFTKEVSGYHATPRFGGNFGWPAVQEFFDISGDRALKLFSGTSYEEPATPLCVIKRIRKYIKRKTEKGQT